MEVEIASRELDGNIESQFFCYGKAYITTSEFQNLNFSSFSKWSFCCNVYTLFGKKGNHLDERTEINPLHQCASISSKLIDLKKSYFFHSFVITCYSFLKS